MTIGILKDVRLFAGGLDLTGRNNKIEMTAKVESKKVTTWGEYDSATDSIWEAVKGGLAMLDMSASGFVDLPALVDADRFAGLGSSGEAWTAIPTGNAAVGSTAWLVNGMGTDYKTFDAVGEVLPWDAQVTSKWPVSRGPVLHPPGTARTATGNGTAVEHVAVAAGQYLYSTLHVLSVAGTSTPTITVKIQSDVDNTFGSPVDQITFAAATATGGQILRTAGAITDTWYRATWTISGSSPSFLLLVGLGVK